MYDDKKIVNVIGTFICALIVIFFATFVPYKIIYSANKDTFDFLTKYRNKRVESRRTLMMWSNARISNNETPMFIKEMCAYKVKR